MGKRIKYTLLGIGILLFLGLRIRALAQPAGDKGDLSKAILVEIDTQLLREEGDSLYAFVHRKIGKHCGTDYACLQKHYDEALSKLERAFKHAAGVLVAKEMLALAREQEDTKQEEQALFRLIALYGFLHNLEADIFYREQLITHYEKTGDAKAAMYERASLLEGRVWYMEEASEVLPKMEAILLQAADKGYTDLVNKLRIRLKYICEEFGMEEKLVEQIEALERIPLSSPLHPSEYRIAFHAASGRADLFLKAGQYEQAVRYYLKALRVFEGVEKDHHQTWLEIYALHRLAKLEQERQDFAEAKIWLDQAYGIADTFGLHDRLALNLGMRIDIAVEEKNYEEAYHFTRELNWQHTILDSLDGEFDVEKYYIASEKKRLEAESARQALELRLSKSQRNSAIAIALLAALTALGFFIGLYQQRRSKQKISTQYHLIQEQTAQLRQLDAAKSQFFANVSHELRTPLTLIAGPVKSLLQTRPLPPAQKALLETIRRNGEQLKLLVDDILDLRKLSAGVMEVHRQPTPVYAFFQEHFAQFESKAEEREMDYRVHLDVAEPIVAELDRAKCRQIANNLLSNAFKFTPPGGQVDVELSLDNDWLELKVTDTGIGITDDELPRIFDRYFQASQAGRTAQGGTGIGLALCKEYAELLGGWVKAESQLGEGSRFCIAFPLTGVSQSTVIESPSTITGESAPQSGSSTYSEASASSTEDSRPAILIVEDNADLRGFLRFTLSPHYKVLEAANGQAALGILRERQENAASPTVRLVISDLMMQPVDGYELLSRLKSQDETCHLPVILLTARAGVKDKIKALRIGVDDYLVKPFEEEELLARVSNLLRNQSQRPASDGDGGIAVVPAALSQEDMAWLEQFEAYVKNNLGNDTLTVSFLATEFSLSESSLLRQVSRITGLTPSQYLKEVRLQAARELLEQRTYRTIAQVAAAVGYNNPRTFSRNFKERFGQSPSAYLRPE
mgnify:CR=1 FL=1